MTPLIFTLESSRWFAERVSRQLGLSLPPHEERNFEDGEHKCRPLTSVRQADVCVLHSLFSAPSESANDKLCQLLFFLATLRDADAARVTAVVPYLCYTRKDRRTQPRDPVTTRYVAQLFEAVGVDRVVTLDVHNPAAFQNAFRCHTELLAAKSLFLEHFLPLAAESEVVVVSPDIGGMKRAERFRQALAQALQKEVPATFMKKTRHENQVSSGTVVGDLQDRTAIVVDDLLSTGTTLSRAARSCREQGARRVYAAATHGLLVDKNLLSQDPQWDQLVLTNTVLPAAPDPSPGTNTVCVLDAAPLFAEAIRRLHSGDSLAELRDE